MQGEWITVSGIIIKGYMVASGLSTNSPYPEGSIKMQWPFFKERGLDLNPLFPATLNVSIKPKQFVVKYPRYTFRCIKWSDEHSPEDFSFSPCCVLYKNRCVSGFVYYPHPETKLDHHHDPSTLEIITTYLKNIFYGAKVDVQINKNEITLLN